MCTTIKIEDVLHPIPQYQSYFDTRLKYLKTYGVWNFDKSKVSGMKINKTIVNVKNL